MIRLTRTDDLPDGVQVPSYDRVACGEGIVHIGLGAFHKAHQAAYTDDALTLSGGDWRIVGVSLRSAEAAEELTPQNGLYTLIESDTDGREARVIGAISRALTHAHGDAEAVKSALAAPSTRIVTITVTEKGYGLDRRSGGIDPDHPAIAHDLADPDAPTGVAGLIVQALRTRREAGTPPFTVLSCDNLPHNGRLTRSLILDFAGRLDADLAAWIEAEVAFPSSMVDRITPAPGDEVRTRARDIIGRQDRAAVETERFRQWVIEDDFPQGRPNWEGAGALLVADVAPYEHMKLRMLNGAHSMLAYAGFLAGHTFVRDVMRHPDLAALVRRHLSAAAATLAPLSGVDLNDYADDLSARFENPHLAHRTYQIAMDGTEKMPQRIFAPAQDAIAEGQPLRPFAFATAVWCCYALGQAKDGTPYDLRDPRAEEITRALRGAETGSKIIDRLFALPRFVPEDLSGNDPFRLDVIDALSSILTEGIDRTIAEEVRRSV